MTGKKGLIKFAIIFMLVLVLSAFRTVTARADDATPAPTATPEVTQPTDDGSTTRTQVAPTDAATPSPMDETVTQVVDTATPVETSTATPVPTDETVTQAADTYTPVDTSTPAPAPTQAAEDTGPTSTDATSLLISQIPQGAQLVLQSVNQPAIPLGSAEAANIIAAGDPIWCPTGVTPKANTGGCTGLFTYFDGTGGLLEALSGKATSGTIWIESTYGDPHDSSGVLLDSTTVGLTPTIVNYALTLQGGWSGNLGTTTITGISTFKVPLTINWNADVTLNDIVVTGVTSGTALTVTTPKNITVTRVKVNTNAGPGAYLDNTAGGAGTGNVVVTSSQFNHNSGGRGLDVQSMGAITLSAVTADTNSGDGAHLVNDTAASPKNVTLTSGPYEFNGNGVSGFAIFSKGAIILKDIDALKNSLDGAYLDNTSATTAQAITLTGTNIFSENGYDGLHAYSNGPISANNLVANANGRWGADLENSLATSAQPVTLTGSNLFNSNLYGLAILSKGNLTLNSITASYNSGIPYMSGWASGAELDNCLKIGPNCVGTGNITLTGTNSFEENYRTGLIAKSTGTITISNLSADGNGHNSGDYGALLDNTYATTPKTLSLTGTNRFNANYYNGLSANSNGAISANNMMANDNGRWGADLENGNTSPAQPVTLTGSNLFNSNKYGLVILSKGNLVLNNISASYNWGDPYLSGWASGAELDDCPLGPPCTGTGNITLTGTNSFEENYRTGLIARSTGTITISNLSADGNGHDYVTPANSGGSGAILDNTFAATPKALTLTGTNSFSGNYNDGLNVKSRGAITVSSVTASNNQIGDGTDLYNHGAGAVGSVTVSGTNRFNSNGSVGLLVLSKGAITLNNMDVSLNLDNGASLDNTYATTLQSVKLTGTNRFDANGGNGLYVASKGAITLNNVDASTNSDRGAQLDNSSASTPQAVTLIGTLNTFSNNTGGNGLEIQTKGAVTIANLSASGNSGAGAAINNQISTASPQNVILTGSNTLNNNGDSGLAITTYGTITANNLTANINGSNHGAFGWGAYLDNCAYSSATCHSTLAKSITLTGTNTFQNNYQDGLQATSKGPIQVNALIASGNGASGAYLNNQWGTGSSGGITLTGVNIFSGNTGGEGLWVKSNGPISVSNLTAQDNAFDGASLDTHGLTTAQSVTLTGSSIFATNGNYGLVGSADGNISVNNVIAAGNGGDGADLDNCFWDTGTSKCLGSGTITLTGTNTFFGNSQDGLSFRSHKAVTINHVATDVNGGIGINGSTDGGSITVLSGSMTGNTSYGWQFNALTTVTLKGVFAYGNHGGVEPENNLVGGSLIIVRSYP